MDGGPLNSLRAVSLDGNYSCNIVCQFSDGSGSPTAYCEHVHSSEAAASWLIALLVTFSVAIVALISAGVAITKLRRLRNDQDGELHAAGRLHAFGGDTVTDAVMWQRSQGPEQAPRAILPCLQTDQYEEEIEEVNRSQQSYSHRE